MAFSNLSFEYSGGTGATVLSGSPEPWAIATGTDLDISVGGTTETWVFVAGDGASAATMAATINLQSTLVQASDDGGYLRLTSLAPGSQAELIVLGGTANGALIFPTSPSYGVTYFGTPWAWTRAVVHVGKEVRELFDDLVDETRENFGISWFAASAYADEQSLFTDNMVASFFEKFRVFDTGWGSVVNHVLPGVPELFTQNDPAVLPDVEQFQVYESGWDLEPQEGTYGPTTPVEPTDNISDGTFSVMTFDGEAETVDAFKYFIPGDRYKNPATGGDNSLVIGAENYSFRAADLPPGLTLLEETAFRSRALAAQVNRHSEVARAFAHKHPIYPEVGIFLYPIIPLADYYASSPTLDGVGFSAPVPGGGMTSENIWSWEDTFPPRI